VTRYGGNRWCVPPSCALGVLLIALSGCGEPEALFEEAWITAGGRKIRAEVARTPAQRARGLMFRKSLPEDGGMLFVYDRPVRDPFWMKNTRIPLSIAFLDRSGRVIEIQDMAPFDLTLHLPLAEYVHALEMNQGWFGRNGVRAGDVIGLEAAP
jgi:hypothetical protein